MISDEVGDFGAVGHVLSHGSSHVMNQIHEIHQFFFHFETGEAESDAGHGVGVLGAIVVGELEIHGCELNDECRAEDLRAAGSKRRVDRALKIAEDVSHADVVGAFRGGGGGGVVGNGVDVADGETQYLDGILKLLIRSQLRSDGDQLHFLEGLFESLFYGLQEAGVSQREGRHRRHRRHRNRDFKWSNQNKLSRRECCYGCCRRECRDSCFRI